MCCQYKKSLSRASWTTHSNPCSMFAPVIALHRTMVHLCVLIASKSSSYRSLALSNQHSSATDTIRISSSVMQLPMSVLFEKTNKLAPINRCRCQLRPELGELGPPLQAVNPPAHYDSPQCAGDLSHPQPKLKHPSFQSNFSSKTEASFDRRHPLDNAKVTISPKPWDLVHVHMFSL